GHLGHATAVERRAVRDGVLHQLADQLELVLGHHRPDLGVALHRVPDLQAAGALHHAVDEAVRHVVQDVDALDPRAGLTSVREAAPEAAGDRVGEVRVLQHDLRVLAAQLEHRALHALRTPDPDTAPDL